jgi:hypothetical protein
MKECAFSDIGSTFFIMQHGMIKALSCTGQRAACYAALARVNTSARRRFHFVVATLLSRQSVRNVQVLAAAGPMAAITSSGMTTGFSAVLLPQLQAPGSALTATEVEASWIGE